MEFRILGPLENVIDGVSRNLGGARQRALLATLLLEPNRPLSTDRLARFVYSDAPPATYRAQIQMCVSALRRMLIANDSAARIATGPFGYVLEVPDSEIDALCFGDLCRKARDQGDPRVAVGLYRKALAQWRGQALDGLESRLVRAAAASLTEQRITATESCLELELKLGRHQHLVSELFGLADEHPYRERLRALLMLALYRSGRQAEALQVYRSVRQKMIMEFGIEPDERLKQLEHAILTSDRTLLPASRSAGTDGCRNIRYIRSRPPASMLGY